MRRTLLLVIFATTMPLGPNIAFGEPNPVYRYRSAAVDPSDGPEGGRFVVEFPNSVGRQVTDLEFTQGGASVTPTEVRVGGNADPGLIFDKDPSTGHIISDGYRVEATFPGGAKPDGITVNGPRNQGPHAVVVTDLSSGVPDRIAVHPQLNWSTAGPKALPAVRTASGESLHMPAGWRKLCGPVSAGGSYNRGTHVFTNYRLRDHQCGLDGQALVGTRYATFEDGLSGTPASSGMIVAAERWILDNPTLPRYQVLEIWVRD